MTSFKKKVCIKVWNNFFKILLFCIPMQLIHFDCVNGFLNSIKEIIWQTEAVYCCLLIFNCEKVLLSKFLATPYQIWSCVIWWDLFALQTAKFMICPPFHFKLMYLENRNSHTDRSIHLESLRYKQTIHAYFNTIYRVT